MTMLTAGYLAGIPVAATPLMGHVAPGVAGPLL